jgi:hypothetical protein
MWSLHYPTITRAMNNPRMVRNQTVWWLPHQHLSKRQPSNLILRDDLMTTRSSISLNHEDKNFVWKWSNDCDIFFYEGFIFMIWWLLDHDIKIDWENDLVAAKLSLHYFHTLHYNLVAIRLSPHYLHKKMTWRPPSCLSLIPRKSDMAAARLSSRYCCEKMTWWSPSHLLLPLWKNILQYIKYFKEW